MALSYFVSVVSASALKIGLLHASSNPDGKVGKCVIEKVGIAEQHQFGDAHQSQSSLSLQGFANQLGPAHIGPLLIQPIPSLVLLGKGQERFVNALGYGEQQGLPLTA
jgi:hypothetical protein